MKHGYKITKHLAAVLTICVLLCLFALPALADTEGNYTYDVWYDEVTITKYTGSDTNLVIPSTLGGYPVTAIGDEAFAYCEFITSLVIPEGVTSIGWNAFERCEGLIELSLPDSLSKIGIEAFAYCTSLESVSLPESLIQFF